jgi:hypothetical protein
MSKEPLCLAALLCLASSLAAQGIASYFPAQTGPKAAKLLAAIDQGSSAIEARRAAAWKSENSAEAEAVEAYALIAASRSGQGPWASPDGSAKSSDAPSALTAARSSAKAAALALASGEDGSAEALASRDAASETLAKLILSSGIGAKSAIALGKLLSGKSKDLRLFPEIAEIEESLRKAGASGAREAAAAASRRSAESVALSLIAAKARILALAPGTDGPLARLEADLRAYRSWMVAFAVAAYPGDLASVSEADRAAIAAGIGAFAALRPDRASLLVEAMAMGDGRDAAAAQSARRLAEAWQRSPEPRRRTLAALCGSPESTMASFCFALAPRPKIAEPRAGNDALAIVSALNGLAAAIAEEEASSSAARGPEPALLLLERPELAAAARSEERYASLFAEASRRLGAIYAQAAEDASAKLEASPSLAKAATRALGSKLSSLSVRAVDLSLPPEESGRRLAFVATASDASGSSFSLPLSAALAAEQYALAFAKAAGLDSSKANPAPLLAKYGQWIVSAYDPEGADDGLVVDTYPSGVGPARLGSLELELALLEGWNP